MENTITVFKSEMKELYKVSIGKDEYIVEHTLYNAVGDESWDAHPFSPTTVTLTQKTKDMLIEHVKKLKEEIKNEQTNDI
jgi:hypothetical protein